MKQWEIVETTKWNGIARTSCHEAVMKLLLLRFGAEFTEHLRKREDEEETDKGHASVSVCG